MKYCLNHLQHLYNMELLPPAGDAYDKVTTWWDLQNFCQIF